MRSVLWQYSLPLLARLRCQYGRPGNGLCAPLPPVAELYPELPLRLGCTVLATDDSAACHTCHLLLFGVEPRRGISDRAVLSRSGLITAYPKSPTGLAGSAGERPAHARCPVFCCDQPGGQSFQRASPGGMGARL